MLRQIIDIRLQLCLAAGDIGRQRVDHVGILGPIFLAERCEGGEFGFVDGEGFFEDDGYVGGGGVEAGIRDYAWVVDHLCTGRDQRAPRRRSWFNEGMAQG